MPALVSPKCMLVFLTEGVPQRSPWERDGRRKRSLTGHWVWERNPALPLLICSSAACRVQDFPFVKQGCHFLGIIRSCFPSSYQRRSAGRPRGHTGVAARRLPAHACRLPSLSASVVPGREGAASAGSGMHTDQRAETGAAWERSLL